ncbi:MAG TPA: GAF domain-containing protein [Aggregatilineales bacterium]|nr:GAF domain-containing protein [Aggregatilineales bacterium]
MKSPATFTLWSLRAKLLLFVMVVLIILIGVTVYTVGRFASVTQPFTNTLVQTLAHERAEQLSSEFGGVTSALRQFLTQGETLVDLDALSNSRTNQAYIGLVNDAMQKFLQTRPEFRQIRFVLNSGETLLTYPSAEPSNYSKEDWFGELASKDTLPLAYVDHVAHSPEGDTINVIDIANYGNVRIGYIVASIDPSSFRVGIYDSLRETAYGPGTIAFYMVEQKGQLNSPFVPPIQSNPDHLATSLDLLNVVSPDPYLYVSPITGVQSLGFAVALPAYNRTLVAETRSIMVGDINIALPLTAQSLIILAVTLIILALGGVLLDLGIIRPVRQLRRAAADAVQNGTTIPLPPSVPNDEIGDLYQTFNALAERTLKDDQMLETRVGERMQTIENAQDVMQILFGLRDTTILLDHFQKLVLDRFKMVQHVQVYLIDATGQMALLRSASGEEGAMLLKRDLRCAVNDSSPVGRAIAHRDPVILRGNVLDTDHDMNPARTDIRRILPEMQSELVLVLEANEGSIGAVDLYSRDRQAFTDLQVRQFREMCRALAQTLVNARQFEDMAARLAETEAQSQRMLAQTWQDYALSRRRDASSSPLIEPWSDLQRAAMESNQIVERNQGDFVTFAVPISLRGQTLGAVEWDVPRGAYTSNTRQLASDLASRLAISADNARLFEQSERLAQRERLVNSISNRLVQQSDVADILQIAVQEVGRVLHVPQAAIRIARTAPDEKP